MGGGGESKFAEPVEKLLITKSNEARVKSVV
jgi:hypothetical protein